MKRSAKKIQSTAKRSRLRSQAAVLNAPHVQSMQTQEVRKLHQLATKVRARAYAPYSNFQVGAALATEDGKVFVGCNVENASFGGAVCAERTAILKAVSEGERKFSAIVVITDSSTPAMPCALCLQTMAEFFAPKTQILIANLEDIVAKFQFSDLLPFPFGPLQLQKAKNEF